MTFRDIEDFSAKDLLVHTKSVLLNKGEVSLPQFGTFWLVKQKGRIINSFGKNIIELKDFMKVRFTPHARLKRMIKFIK